MQGSTNSGGVRQAELLASLSLAIDLGLGLPAEWMQRTALVSVRLALAAGLSQQQQRTCYFLALIRNIGCTSTSLADARLMGNEMEQVALFMADPDDGPGMMAVLVRDVGAGLPLAEQAATRARFFEAAAGGVFAENHRNHCEGGAILAERLGLGAEVSSAMWSMYERWNGNGSRGLAGEEVDLAARVMHVASVASHFHSEGGVDLAGEVLRQRSGQSLDPKLCGLMLKDAPILLADLNGPLAQTVLAAEPGTSVVLSGPPLTLALEAIADFTDAKIPQTLGHSRRVAELAAGAARLSGLPGTDAATLATAGYIHDVGRLGVSAGLLARPGPLTPAEWERIRLHPYLTERVFAASPALAPAARLAAMHHERQDGSGYHRGLGASELSGAARILAAANAFAALTEERPHRLRSDAGAAAKALTKMGRDGVLDVRAVDAVLAGAGEVNSNRRSANVTMSEREIEVLRLLARQNSNKEIARELGISPKTVEHHVSHIFDKTGCTTRTGAALYATHNALL